MCDRVRPSPYLPTFDVVPELTTAEGIVLSITPCLVSLLLALVDLRNLTWSYQSSRVGVVLQRLPYYLSWVVVPTSLISAMMLKKPSFSMWASATLVSNSSRAACCRSCRCSTLQALVSTLNLFAFFGNWGGCRQLGVSVEFGRLDGRLCPCNSLIFDLIIWRGWDC